MAWSYLDIFCLSPPFLPAAARQALQGLFFLCGPIYRALPKTRLSKQRRIQCVQSRKERLIDTPQASNRENTARLPRNVLQSMDFPQQIADFRRWIALPHRAESRRSQLLSVRCLGWKVACSHNHKYCIFIQYQWPVGPRQSIAA